MCNDFNDGLAIWDGIVKFQICIILAEARQWLNGPPNSEVLWGALELEHNFYI